MDQIPDPNNTWKQRGAACKTEAKKWLEALDL